MSNYNVTIDVAKGRDYTIASVAFPIVTIALFVGALCVLSGCDSTAGQFRVITPIGDFTNETSGTSTLDLRGLWPKDEAPPKDYTADLDRLTVKQTLEK